MKVRFLVVCLLFGMVGSVSASDFEKVVRPILVEHCTKCHGAEKQKGGLRLDSRTAALAGGETGPAFVPGKAKESLLVKAIHHDGLEMPPSGKMEAAKIIALEKWIDAGAIWPETTKPQETLTARKPGTITEQDRNWWAFRPVTSPKLPSETPWTLTSIDRFIAAQHKALKLTPAIEAPKAVLLRRVTFDLTGLPPTPAELDAFLADSSPGAYEKVVDRLLASPAYGERQARLWLDLVRYGESDGYKQDAYRPTAWKYRDYVIRSFNADKPYDRFVQEQLAGDELDPTNPEALLATGFLRLPIYEYNQADVRGQWNVILNDLTDVTGDVFLAMGVSCARCHDHKFDPVLQKDYYALQAFFAGLKFADDPIYRTATERTEYDKAHQEWTAKVQDIQARMAALVEAPGKKALEAAINRFPKDIGVIVRKPASERTPLEMQLYDLAIRQANDRQNDNLPSKLPAKDKAEYDALKKQLEPLLKAKPANPTAMIARDIGPVAAPTMIPGAKATIDIPPRTMTVLGGRELPFPKTDTSTGRRLALAQWLTAPENPLTARVMVNRVWQQHFGRGLVATPSDFGTLGEKPTHPELLDHLAAEFVKSGWKMKPLHKLMVTSAVYRQSSQHVDPNHDPDNRSWTRMPIRRLDAEQARDALLAVSGDLKNVSGGASVNADQPRRSIYTKIYRNTPDPLLASLDAADGVLSCACRNQTITPTQSLLFLNHPAMLNRAKSFATEVMPANGEDAPKGIFAAYRKAFGRAPTDSEAADALAYLRQQVGKPATPESRLAAWTDFCHALMNANEFLYLD
ncbi:MAG: PSD1 and planctomycete cytochrome C domain-containing protein [Fimbriiglobus sp.]